MRKLALASVALALFLTGVAVGHFGKTPPPTRSMALWGVPVVPPVKAYAEGREIRFIHTEVSDGRVAATLTRMMGSPVLAVPALARAPQELLAPVYVFANGLPGEGPLDHQIDVFDAPPGSDAYRPLRAVHVVTWREPARARLLRSAAEVRAAEAAGELQVAPSGVVVNMPFLVWPGGGR
jgi:hypothetical protein